jgi:hypothetical protein
MDVRDGMNMVRKAGGTAGLAELIRTPASSWGGRCHEISLALVKTGVFGETARVARGAAEKVTSQHSWIVVGEPLPGMSKANPYDPAALVIDPTIFSYRDEKPNVVVTPNRKDVHRPHGSGSIWDFGRPDPGPGNAVELVWHQPPSSQAKLFLEALGPLDQSGWMQLAHYPVEQWPSGEIIGAIADTLGAAVVPVDILGMVTERNPKGFYW